MGPPLPGPVWGCKDLSPSVPLLAGWEVYAAKSRGKSLLSVCSPAACCSPERLLAFLLPKLDTSNERTRVGTLQVLRHIINSAGECTGQARESGEGPPALNSLKMFPTSDFAKCLEKFASDMAADAGCCVLTPAILPGPDGLEPHDETDRICSSCRQGPWLVPPGPSGRCSLFPFLLASLLVTEESDGCTLVSCLLDGPSGKWDELSWRMSLGLLVSDRFLTVGWKVPGFLL